MSDRNRLNKVLAIAINPAAYEQEAIVALHKARELVKREPELAFSLPDELEPLPRYDDDEASFEVEVRGVSEFWLPIVLNTLSERAYVLDLKSKLSCDFATPTTVHVKCDGRETACKAFEDHFALLMEYIKSRKQGH